MIVGLPLSALDRIHHRAVERVGKNPDGEPRKGRATRCSWHDPLQSAVTR